MKRVEAVIVTEKCSAVIDALKKIGVGGITFVDAKGRGAGQREAMQGSRGTTRVVPEFHSRTSLMTVVDDAKVEAVINAITSAASTGSKGDGKIFIFSVEDVVDIGTRKRGNDAL